MTIDVKERSDGQFVYSFSAERQNKRLGTRRTLHAAVTHTENDVGNAQSSETTIPQPREKSNTKEENAYVYAYGQRAQDHDGVIRTGILACGRAGSRL